MSANLKNFNKRCELTYKIQPAELKQVISCGAFIKQCQQVVINECYQIASCQVLTYQDNGRCLNRLERSGIQSLFAYDQTPSTIIGFCNAKLMPERTKNATNLVLTDLSTTYNVPVKM